MYNWVEIGGVRSDTLAVEIMRYEHPRMATLQRERTYLPGRLSALVSDYAQPEAEELIIELAILGNTQAECLANYRGAGIDRWLNGLALPPAERKWTAPSPEYSEINAGNTVIRFDDLPDHYFVGRINAIELVEFVDEWLHIKAVLHANPPCALRAISKQAEYIPSLVSPPPEQITPENETCSGAFAQSGWLPNVDYKGVHAASLYFAITGTWERLQIGGGTGLGLEWPRATLTTVYIDCDAQQIYYIEDDQRISLSSAAIGDYPKLREPGGIAIGGEGIDITARLLLIERG